MTETGLEQEKDREIVSRALQELELLQPDEEVADAAALRGRIAEGTELLRLRLRKDLHEGAPDPLLVVVSGGTNVGKSTVFNGLVGRALAAPTFVARGTKVPLVVGARANHDLVMGDRLLVGYARAPLGDPEELHRESGSDTRAFRFVLDGVDLPEDLLLVDSTDVDSDREANLRIARDLLVVADAVVFVVSPTKYRDAAVVEAMRRSRDLGHAVWTVWNPWEAGHEEALEDYRERVLGGDLEGGLSDRIHRLEAVPGGELEGLARQLAPLRGELEREARERVVVRARGLRAAGARVVTILRELEARWREEATIVDRMRSAVREGRNRALQDYRQAVREVSARTVEEPFRVVWEKTRVPVVDATMDHAWALLRRGLWLIGFVTPSARGAKPEALDERDHADLRTLMQRLVDHVDAGLAAIGDPRYARRVQELRQRLAARSIEGDLNGLAAFATRARREWIDVRVADTLQVLAEQPARYRLLMALRTVLTIVPAILLVWWIHAFAALIFVLPGVHGLMSHLVRRGLFGFYLTRHRGSLEKAWVGAVGEELDAGWVAQAEAALPNAPDPATLDRLERLAVELDRRVARRVEQGLRGGKLEGAAS